MKPARGESAPAVVTRGGFSLVELLVVIATIALLGAAAADAGRGAQRGTHHEVPLEPAATDHRVDDVRQ